MRSQSNAVSFVRYVSLQSIAFRIFSVDLRPLELETLTTRLESQHCDHLCRCSAIDVAVRWIVRNDVIISADFADLSVPTMQSQHPCRQLEIRRANLRTAHRAALLDKTLLESLKSSTIFSSTITISTDGSLALCKKTDNVIVLDMTARFVSVCGR